MRRWLLLTGAVALLVSIAIPASAGPRSKGDPKPIGVVGCSNTMEHTQAYAEHSEVDQMALVQRSYGGGTPIMWGQEGGPRRNLEKTYLANRPAEGYDAVWWQLCWRWWELGESFDQPEQDDLTRVVEWVRAQDPGVLIYVSPINFFDPEGSCPVIADAHPLIVEAADWVVATFENIERGPDTGPLSLSMRDADACHLNTTTAFDLVGPQLVAFFD